MSLVAPISASRAAAPDRRARLAAIAFAVAVHVLALLSVLLTATPPTTQPSAPPVALALKPPTPRPPQPAAPKRRAGGSPATAPKRAPPRSPRPQPATLPPVRIRPPAPVPILPTPAPTLAAPKGPDLASPVTGAGVSVGTGGQGAGQGNGPGGQGGESFDPTWVDGPTSRQIDDAYPRAAHRAGLGGSVILRCRELVDGRVDHCSVLEETPAGAGFGKAALRLSRTFRFHPFLVDGKPRETFTTVPYDFALFDMGRLRDDGSETQEGPRDPG